MNKFFSSKILSMAFGCTLLLATSQFAEPNDNTSRWPGFRGSGDSQTTAKELPLTWAENENIKWSIDLPGYGQSSPVVWDGRVFVTSSAGKMKNTLIVQCLDLADGKELWTQHFDGTQKIKRSKKVTQSAPTPAVDATRLFAFFESGDLIALDHNGKKLWLRSLTKEYGMFTKGHGIGSSIAQTDDAIILLIAQKGPSYLISIDKKTGANNWKIDQPERISWTTPVISKYKDREEVIISSDGAVEAYNAKTGKQLWFVEGLKKNLIPSPTVTDNLVIIGAAQKRYNLAIDRSGSGNVTKTHIRWKSDAPSSSFASPVVFGQRVYVVSKAGKLSCLDLQTGKTLWFTPVEEETWASPIAAGERLYFFGKDGKTTIINASADSVEILSRNFLPNKSPVYGVAAVDGALLIRTGSRLTRIGQ